MVVICRSDRVLSRTPGPRVRHGVDFGDWRRETTIRSVFGPVLVSTDVIDYSDLFVTWGFSKVPKPAAEARTLALATYSRPRIGPRHTFSPAASPKTARRAGWGVAFSVDPKGTNHEILGPRQSHFVHHNQGKQPPRSAANYWEATVTLRSFARQGSRWDGGKRRLWPMLQDVLDKIPGHGIPSITPYRLNPTGSADIVKSRAGVNTLSV